MNGNENRVPWRKIHEFLVEVGSSTSLEGYFRRVIAGVGRLIPTDAAAGLLDERGRLLFGAGLSEEAGAAYNDYYRFHIPLIDDPSRFAEAVQSVGVVEWREFASTEFVAGFTQPNHIAHSIAHYRPGREVVLSLHRSGASSTFSEPERETLALLDPHLSNLYRCFAKLSHQCVPSLAPHDVHELFPLLSMRESEVASLLLDRLTAAEIASYLFISPRTAESHIASIYLKLDVRSRNQARRRILDRAFV